MPSAEVLERIVLKNLRKASGLLEEEFPKSLGILVHKEARAWRKGRKTLRTILLKESTEKKLKALSLRARCSKAQLIRIILDFELLPKEELRKKYMAP